MKGKRDTGSLCFENATNQKTCFSVVCCEIEGLDLSHLKINHWYGCFDFIFFQDFLWMKEEEFLKQRTDGKRGQNEREQGRRRDQKMDSLAELPVRSFHSSFSLSSFSFLSPQETIFRCGCLFPFSFFCLFGWGFDNKLMP